MTIKEIKSLKQAEQAMKNATEESKFLIEKLNKSGFEAYVVGGSVRDSFLGLPISDIDIATSATPDEIKEVFGEYTSLENGLKHGTVPIIVKGTMYEITTFRQDGEYEDSRRPNEVFFTRSFEEDVKRRDFTINSLGYSPLKGIIDFEDGISDLMSKKIKAVGNADERFSEDPLRIIRGLRFASKLGFTIEEETKKAMFENKEKLKSVSAERLSTELKGLLVGKDAFKVINDNKDIIAVLVPELEKTFNYDQQNPHHIFSLWKHSLLVMSNANSKKHPVEFKLAGLLHDIGKPNTFQMNEIKKQANYFGHEEESAKIAEEILRKLKFSNKEIAKVAGLILDHGLEISEKPYKIKKNIYEMGTERFLDMIDFQIADNSSKLNSHNEKVAKLERIKDFAQEYIKQDPILSHKQLKVTPQELIEEGIKGKNLGETLNYLVLQVISGTKNEKESLISQAVRKNLWTTKQKKSQETETSSAL